MDTIGIHRTSMNTDPNLAAIPADRKPLGYVKPTLGSILAAVAYKYQFSLDELRAKGKYANVARARNEYYYRALQETDNSYKQIGLHIRRVDHTTVMHGATRHALSNKLPLPRRGIHSQTLARHELPRWPFLDKHVT